MQNLEDERDIGFVNTLSTIVSIISIVAIISLTGYLIIQLFLDKLFLNESSHQIIIAFIVLFLVLVSGGISIREFNKLGYVILSSFFGLFSLLHVCSIIYLMISNLLNSIPISLYQVIIYILLLTISYAFYYIFKRLNQIFKP